jgi:hypothetical protein
MSKLLMPNSIKANINTRTSKRNYGKLMLLSVSINSVKCIKLHQTMPMSKSVTRCVGVGPIPQIFNDQHGMENVKIITG